LLFCETTRRPPSSTLFPYTTLFRSSIDTSDSDVKDLDFGVAAGLGYKFDNGFYLQARYNYGITKIIEDADVHNSVFQAGIGIVKDRKSTRLNSSHVSISYAVFCLKK